MGRILVIIFASVFTVVVNAKILRPNNSTSTASLYPEWAKPIASLLLSNPPPTCFMSTPQLIEYWGYPVETHNITTLDGYILTYFRIPYGKNGTADKEPVLVHHGVVASSNDWLLLTPNNTLPFLLADSGYDVWLGNARGNNYSQAHTSLSPDDLAFWNFTYHEMGVYDLPPVFDYILSHTNRTQGKLSYIGHSMGTTMFFIGMDRHPDLQQKVNKMIALAPVAYLQHMKTPAAKIALAQVPSFVVEAYFNLLSRGRTFPKEFNNFLKVFGPLLCSGEITSKSCDLVLYTIAGYEIDAYSKETASMIYGHTPSDSSGKILAHFLQYVSRSYLRILDAGICNYTALGDNLEPKFQEYDYGCVGNLRQYNSTEPPLYSLGKNLVNTMVMYGPNDYLVQPVDAQRVIRELANINQEFTKQVDDPKFNHLDFNYKDNVGEKVYKHCLLFLEA